MKNEDRIRLQHMLDAARDALSFAEGRVREDLEADRQLALAVVKCVEIIGEAASQVSPETQGELPELPWPKMVAMRHRLVHTYYDINLDVVWSTLGEDLPPLVETLQVILGRA
ncbi:MAG: DUF86 domain-containing protein [Candidatus Brocadiae bacterium]|nr:DUF86 domain-containing protein [Candidatus Brocadiia bacterium]